MSLSQGQGLRPPRHGRLASLVLATGMLLALTASPTRAEVPSVERYVLPKVDPASVRRQDEERVHRGSVAHYAEALTVDVTPWDKGAWELLSQGRARWRLHLVSAGARSLNLGFSRFKLPHGASLVLQSPDGRLRIGPFTGRDNETHGQLWTPPMATDELVLELIVPVERLEELELKLTRVNHGYAGFGEKDPRSGTCNVDVACAEAAAWRDVARSVALVSIDGVKFCTGFLVNNTALDGRPFLLTAQHCGVTRLNAPSVVVFWNHESTVCRRGVPTPEEASSPAGDLGHFQTGAMFRAAYRGTDVVLLELDDRPLPSANVFYAGWDRSGSTPEESVVIHHPNTDAKRISFDFDPATPTLHLEDEVTPRGTSLRIGHWELGTTEGGSSGAPLFNRDRRVVGQLHGGYAACGNRRSDWFGRFSASWLGGGALGSRLSDWLDPLGSDALVLDGIDGAAVFFEPPEFASGPP